MTKTKTWYLYFVMLYITDIPSLPACRQAIRIHYGIKNQVKSRTRIFYRKKLMLREDVVLPKPYNESWIHEVHGTPLWDTWPAWIEDYMQKIKMEATEPDVYTDIPEPPVWWDDVVGTGFKGNHTNFPPWAYQPINYGIPPFCYLLPESGFNCKNPLNVIRYFYNPYIDNCPAFRYNCHGNRNNFVTYLNCLNTCVTGKDAMKPGCDHNSGVPTDSSNPFHDLIYG